MKTRGFVVKTEGSKVWLAVEAESCSICPSIGQEGAACPSCGCREVFASLEAKNSLSLPLKPGMKVAASFTQGRAIFQAAVSFGIPLAMALAAYLAAPAMPEFAKPVSALAALIGAALLVCAISSLVKKKFPHAYGELEVTEILEEPRALRFPGT